MKVENIYDEATGTFSYIVVDEDTSQCAIIDSVLDYEAESGKVSTNSCDKIIRYVKKHKLIVQWILETHPHADHLTGSHYLKEELGGKIGIGEKIKDVLSFWVPIYHNEHDTPIDGQQFDHLFRADESFKIGNISVKVLQTPGHTPACLSYLIEDTAFVGDTLLMPHIGTARVDFPGGSADILYDSIQKLMQLPDETKIYICHDYPGDGIDAACMATVKEHKQNNKMIREGISKEQYIKTRTEKDRKMKLPKLILPSLQVNLRAGDLGKPESNNIRYLKIPLNKF